METYTATINYKLEELHIYGSSRLGIHKPDTQYCSFTVDHYFNPYDSTWKPLSYTAQCTTGVGAASYTEHTRIRGKRFYELSNHLGNVLTTITDRKLPIGDTTGGIDTVLYFVADISTVNDYYPFGMLQPERSYSNSEYRFGFNGQEKDDEISGTGNSYTAEFWQYDPRLGRRWNVDPVVKEWESPYASFTNNPIFMVDPNGDHADGWLVNEITGKTTRISKEGGQEAQYIYYADEEGLSIGPQIDGPSFNLEYGYDGYYAVSPDEGDLFPDYSSYLEYKEDYSQWIYNGLIYTQITSNTLIVNDPKTNDAYYAFIPPESIGTWNEPGSDGLYHIGCPSCHHINGAYRYAAYNSKERLNGSFYANLIIGPATGYVVAGYIRSLAVGGAASTVSNLSIRTDIVLSGGRSGQLVKTLTGPANSVVKGSQGRIFITDDAGKVIWDVTKDRAKSVIPGQGFGPKVAPTQEQLNLLKQVWGN